MDAKFKTALRDICADEIAAALVTITAVKGSTPRKPGAKMLVLPDGQVFGTIGGGCGEAEVKRISFDALDNLASVKYLVNMTNDMAEEEGMVCGGIMEVFIDVIHPGANPQKELFTDYLTALAKGERPVLVTVLAAAGETGLLGQKLLWAPSGKQSGDLGHDKLNELAAERAEQVFAEGKTRKITVPAESGQSEYELLLEPAPAPWELLVLGGGHIAQPLSQIANMLGIGVTVVDDRPAFANSARFPTAAVICDDFVQALRKMEISPSTFVVVVTRGHRHDKLCLQEVLVRPTAYIGMIGSRRRVKALMAELREDGISEELLERVYSPIGLDIAAETPEEIAVSILAELINIYRGGRAKSLKLNLSSQKGCEA